MAHLHEIQQRVSFTTFSSYHGKAPLTLAVAQTSSCCVVIEELPRAELRFATREKAVRKGNKNLISVLPESLTTETSTHKIPRRHPALRCQSLRCANDMCVCLAGGAILWHTGINTSISSIYSSFFSHKRFYLFHLFFVFIYTKTII